MHRVLDTLLPSITNLLYFLKVFQFSLWVVDDSYKNSNEGTKLVLHGFQKKSESAISYPMALQKALTILLYLLFHMQGFLL